MNGEDDVKMPKKDKKFWDALEQPLNDFAAYKGLHGRKIFRCGLLAILEDYFQNQEAANGDLLSLAKRPMAEEKKKKLREVCSEEQFSKLQEPDILNGVLKVQYRGVFFVEYWATNNVYPIECIDLEAQKDDLLKVINEAARLYYDLIINDQS
jgi:hypothetical protein